ncbi:MAG: hypothetical protein HY260_06210, partial [Chloroflexi bacterium]|nr:hypothetical protein [Chloroflexota bacterium]
MSKPVNAKIVRRLILAALVILLIVVAAGLKSIFVRREAFQRGVVYASWWHGEYSSAESDTTL